MEEQLLDYEKKKRAIRFKKATRRQFKDDLDEFDPDLFDSPEQVFGLSDVAQVGSKILIGGGLGLLAGVATIAVAAGAAEVIIAGVVTKIAGVIGGAVGLSLGVNKYMKEKKKRYSEEY
jgi:hypothetical protein